MYDTLYLLEQGPVTEYLPRKTAPVKSSVHYDIGSCYGGHIRKKAGILIIKFLCPCITVIPRNAKAFKSLDHIGLAAAYASGTPYYGRSGHRSVIMHSKGIGEIS